ncbi:zinc finger protein 69 homolog isoform X2 [Dermacentor albipictus]|uniref:zinc finger protein 69 homolog isoform X2 n=1 Tax=Dermacentor albipictus TaxID=60249 RepID=UPI0038FC7238
MLPLSALRPGQLMFTDIITKIEPPDPQGDIEGVAVVESPVLQVHTTGNYRNKCFEVDHQHQCKICRLIFNTRLHLLQHSVTHAKELPFLCANCGAAFARAEDVAEHENTRHFNKQEYRCVGCPETYGDKAQLWQHVQSHYGKPAYHCEMCPMVFPLQHQLSKHLRTHTKEVHYTCSQCKATFMHRESLARHSKTHQGLRKHQCPYCPKAFIHRGYLVEHERIHTGERPFTCRICDEKFVQRSHLNVHRHRMGH